MIVKIFFDLDGTLLDATQRMYQLFQKLVPGSGLSYDQYWIYKRDKLSHRHILKEFFLYKEEEIVFFEREWLRQIELKEWLSLDKPFDGIHQYLLHYNKLYQLFLITARQSRESVLWQLEKYGWLNLFEGILVTCQKKEKIDLIKGIIQVNNSDWMVGDTGKDIETGKQLGLRTAAVLTGFLSGEQLSRYSPDIIVETVLKLDFTT